MLIGDRLRELRQAKILSQGHIEKRTGLLRCYVSRVENSHTVPSIETLEKWARALGIPLYQIFYFGDKPLPPPKNDSGEWGSNGSDARMLAQFRRYLSRADDADRHTLLCVANLLAKERNRRSRQ